MFTGIIAGVGQVEKIIAGKSQTQIWIRSPFSLKKTKLGDSIAVDGCCLTATKLKGNLFCADVSPETLAKTNLEKFKKGSKVNLELPLCMGDPLGGHLVQGHVDSVGTLVAKKRVAAKPNPYYLLEVRVPKKLQKYMIPKGSVSVDGISLTVNEVKGARIHLCIIPHTQTKTTLTDKKVGATLNLEADMLLKFAEKRLTGLQLKVRN